MARKRKVRIDRIIILILSFVLICLLVVAGIFTLRKFFNTDTNNSSNSNTNEITNNPDKEDKSKVVNLKVNTHNVFKDTSNTYDFGFIVAEITFASEDNISFNLNNLQTGEGIKLGDVKSYVNRLDANGYNLANMNIKYDISSQENSYTCNIFIPFETDATTLFVYNTIDKSIVLQADLDEFKTFSSLKLETGGDIEIDETNVVYVSDSYITDTLIHVNEPYTYPSATKIYKFEITVKSIDNNLTKIVSAKFIPNSSEKPIEALDEDYYDATSENIINKTLQAGDMYALFFEVFNTDDLNIDGKLVLEYENYDKLVEIDGVLQ